MSAIRLLALILLCTILLGACGRSELIRIRMLTPVNEDKKDYAVFTDTNSSSEPTIINKNTGVSLYFLFKSIGLGYTTITTIMEKKTGTNQNHTEKTTLVTDFADVAFGIGENYSFMWGAGVLSGGKRETSLEYDGGSAPFNPKNNYLGGHSIFFVLGHHGFGFETLLGYRINFIKAEFDESNIPPNMGKTGEEFTYESNKISFTTSQVQLGIGFTF